MKDINDLLSEVLKESGATEIISSPDTFANLQKKGLKPDDMPVLTAQEYIDKLYGEKKAAALEAIELIPALPDIAVPTIRILYKEIVECVLFGLNGAAISLSAVMVEHALKEAIVKKQYGKEYKPEEWDRIEGIELGPAIKEAKGLGILDEDSEKRFIDFKNQIRNPYLHYNIKKLTKGVRAQKVKELNTKTQEVREVEWNTEDHPMLWASAKRFVDRERLKDVLDFVYYATQLLLAENKKEENGAAS